MESLLDISRYQEIYDQLRAAQRRLLNAPMPPAPGAYLVTEQVSGREFVQAVWRSKKKIFQAKRSGKPTRSLYIGKAGSRAHREAENQWRNYQLLKEIEKQVQITNQQIDRIAKLAYFLENEGLAQQFRE